MYLYNSLSRRKEKFRPIKKGKAGFYACGPTVYFFAHIGNLRTYIFEDILKRTLLYNGYKVKHVENITDVGHLTSDADIGEDKVEKQAKKEKKTAWQIAEFYTKEFKKDLKKLNIIEPNIWIKATETIKDQINLIKILEKKGFTYLCSDGVYFDTSKLKTYGRLWPKKMKIKPGARIKMVSGKKNPKDFALWKFSPKGTKRQLEWNSPWGKGFPGWHTECVVMSVKKLGIPFDIHCGGIDHILIHHSNEIAQAEAAYKKILANYWLHSEFLLLKKGRMGKSEKNIITLNNLSERNINPLAFRYLCLGTHYRKKLYFSWDSLKSTQNSLNKLYEKIKELKIENKKTKNKLDKLLIAKYQSLFLKFINDDLNLPKALSLIWKIIKDKKIGSFSKERLLMNFDKVFGLGIEKIKIKTEKIPKQIKELIEKREKFRRNQQFIQADDLRKKINKLGYIIEDRPGITTVRRSKKV